MEVRSGSFLALFYSFSVRHDSDLVFSSENPVLTYEKVGKVFDLSHTIVPVSRRGMGLAEELAEVRILDLHPFFYLAGKVLSRQDVM